MQFVQYLTCVARKTGMVKVRHAILRAQGIRVVERSLGAGREAQGRDFRMTII